MQVITRDDAKKKLEEMEKVGPYPMYSDEMIKMNILKSFIIMDEYLSEYRYQHITKTEEHRNILNLDIRKIKDKTKKLDLIYQRNLMNKYLRSNKAHFNKEMDKLKLYAYHVAKIIKGDWKKEDLPREWL